MPKAAGFVNINDMVELWESHDSAEYWPDTGTVAIDVKMRRNIFHQKMLILRERPERCPRCQSELEEIPIEYVVENTGHLVVIREVPALRCHKHRHEYMPEHTFDHIENLLAREIMNQAQPAEMLHVPVFDLNTAV